LVGKLIEADLIGHTAGAKGLFEDSARAQTLKKISYRARSQPLVVSDDAISSFGWPLWVDHKIRSRRIRIRQLHKFFRYTCAGVGIRCVDVESGWFKSAREML
jgi:hypothetical protein